jgi:hypothetical protein
MALEPEGVPPLGKHQLKPAESPSTQDNRLTENNKTPSESQISDPAETPQKLSQPSKKGFLLVSAGKGKPKTQQKAGDKMKQYQSVESPTPLSAGFAGSNLEKRTNGPSKNPAKSQQKPDAPAPDEYPHGKSPAGRPVTWTGKVVSLAEWRAMSEWDKHGPDGRVWCAISREWIDPSEVQQ